MRVCILRATGKLLGSQGGGDMPLINPESIPPFREKGDNRPWTPEELESAIAAYRAMNLQTLIDNAVRQGYAAEEVEAKFIPDADLLALIEASKTPEQIAKEQAREAAVTAKAQALADYLPAWATVEAAVINAFPDAKQQAFILKLARVVYLDMKNSAD